MGVAELLLCIALSVSMKMSLAECVGEIRCWILLLFDELFMLN